MVKPSYFEGSTSLGSAICACKNDNHALNTSPGRMRTEMAAISTHANNGEIDLPLDEERRRAFPFDSHILCCCQLHRVRRG